MNRLSAAFFATALLLVGMIVAALAVRAGALGPARVPAAFEASSDSPTECPIAAVRS